MMVNTKTNSSQESRLFYYCTNYEHGWVFLEVSAEGIADDHGLVGVPVQMLSKVKNEI